MRPTLLDEDADDQQSGESRADHSSRRKITSMAGS